jgi:dUTP pyrophosphatase
MNLYIETIDEKAQIPEYAHKGDAGMDLYSIENVILEPGERKLIHTGIRIQLPANTEAQIRPRSGLALKHGITVLNTPGTIDEGYRGEVGIILINHGGKKFEVTEEMRIAQMVIKSTVSVNIESIDSLDDTSRGDGGFGSTGE